MNRALSFSPLVFACFALPAQAQSIPRYNVEGYCQQVADVSGGSAMIFNGCMDMEQQAYNVLKPVWAQLPGNSRSYCDEVARVSGGSYSILQGCIEMETDAASSPPILRLLIMAMKIVPTILAAAFGTLLSAPAQADFIDTRWSVVGFTGEAWFINPQGVIGQSQIFNRGYAEGVFYNCDYAGQSSTYTRYDNDAFFANPEFELFKPLREEMTLSSESLFVHRITCEGGGNPAKRRVMYPFVTNEARKSAWYLFEGGGFSLYNP